ncbi:MAG: TetR/AcrR family transcriptional regulator, partial [Deltaproteobacteria bacterium]|nr:TetR/AcrR family transcriptional regulator [Deltaproteobacteria bacterium]
MNNDTDINKRSVDVIQRRKEREKNQRRKKILKAAEKVFAKRGFQGATIQEIALEAELSVGTIYNFFSGKDALYSVILISHLDEMREKVLQHITPIINVKERLKAMLFFQSELIEKNRNFFIIFFRDQSRLPWAPAKDLDKEVSMRYERFLNTLQDIFEEGIEKGIFKPLPPEDLAEAWGGLCHAFFFKWLTEKSKWPLKSKVMT